MTKTKPPSARFAAVFDQPGIGTVVDEIGLFFERFGLRRNVGRTWAVLYLTPEPLDQARLGQVLGLSAGLVSDALKELEHWGAVRSLSIKGERRTYYEAEDRLLRIVAAILAKRDLCAVRDLREAARAARNTADPPGFKRELRRRLREIEVVADLYEVLSTLVIRVSSLSGTAVSTLARAMKSARFWSRVEEPDDGSEDLA